MVADQTHLITGSEDSNVNVWSISNLLSLTSNETLEPLRTLSNHRDAITSLALGHGSTSTNICVSASRDNTCIVWNHPSGTLLRTFLLPTTPLCLALDPCDRAVYVGHEDGSLQLLEFATASAVLNPLYDTKLQDTPVQVTYPPWTASFNPGACYCLGLSHDGTTLLSGHASGKVARWDTGLRAISGGEVVDLNAPVTNLLMLPPFAESKKIKAVTIMKPRLGDGDYTLAAQFIGRATHEQSPFNRILESPGFPSDVLERAILSFATPSTSN